MDSEMVWVLDKEGKLIQIPKPQDYEQKVNAVKPMPRYGTTTTRRTRSAPKTDHPHGTALRYFSTAQCRCDLCRQAATAYSREKRRQHRENPPENLVHGRTNTYSYFGCRCRACKDAMLAHLAKYPPSEASRQARNRRKSEKRKALREAQKSKNAQP